MPKPNKNDCKNGKQTDLLVQGARSAVENLYNTSEWHKLPLSIKVCESQTKWPEYLNKKIFHIWQELKRKN